MKYLNKLYAVAAATAANLCGSHSEKITTTISESGGKDVCKTLFSKAFCSHQGQYLKNSCNFSLFFSNRKNQNMNKLCGLNINRYYSTNDQHNYLLDIQSTPQFGFIKDENIVPGITSLLEDFNKRFSEIESELGNKIKNNEDITWENSLQELERSSDKLEKAYHAVSHMLSVKNTQGLREAHQVVQPKLVQTFAKIGQSKILYETYNKLLERPDINDIQKRILNKSILGAQLSGVSLEEELQAKFNELMISSSALSTKFGNNVMDSTDAYQKLLKNKSDVEGLPKNLLASMSSNAKLKAKINETNPESGPWLLTLDHPCYGPFQQYSKNKNLREETYKKKVAVASEGESDNSKILKQILDNRQAKAKLLNYSTYADVSLATKMADSPEVVNKMIEDLHTSSYSVAQQDLKTLQQYANENGHEGKLELWDVSYWAEHQKNKLYNIDQEILRPYFQLPIVLNGMFDLAEQLFSVSIKEKEIDSSYKWDPEVKYYEVLDNKKNTPIAHFFLDAISRPGSKQGGAWVNPCVSRTNAFEKPRLPVAYVVCNQSPGLDGKPSLMTFRELETLFHEFGHALQHMLTTVDYAEVAGINGIEWDAVELPSQFMENWCYQKSLINKISKHVDTGEALPAEMFDKLVGSRNYMAGSGMLRQLFFSKVDMALHESSDVDPLALYREIARTYTVMPPSDLDRFLNQFNHIFAGGYAAGYYSYKWAEVLAQDAFGAFEEEPDKHKELGEKFKATILSLGGSKPAGEVFKLFRGREPQAKFLLKTYGLQ